MPTGEYSGWFIWAGTTLSTDPDYFEAQHLHHLEAATPELLPYLDLPPGWRFLIAPGYEDVWFDASLLAEGSDVIDVD